MEMASSTISDLRPYVRRRDLLSDVNGGAVRLNLSSFVPSDFASSDRFWIFSYGCHEDCPCNICPVCYVLDNGDSYPRLPNDVDQSIWYIFLGILVLVLLPMLIDYFNGCVRARSLGIAAQINYRRTIFGIIRSILSVAFKKLQDCVLKEEEFEDLEDLLIFF